MWCVGGVFSWLGWGWLGGGFVRVVFVRGGVVGWMCDGGRVGWWWVAGRWSWGVGGRVVLVVCERLRSPNCLRNWHVFEMGRAGTQTDTCHGQLEGSLKSLNFLQLSWWLRDAYRALVMHGRGLAVPLYTGGFETLDFPEFAMFPLA